MTIISLLITAFVQIGSTPIWVPLTIILIIILLFWWGLTRNQIPNEARGHDEEHHDDNQTVSEPENVILEEITTENTEVIESEVEEVEPNPPAVPDDLKLIEGIGPKIASILADAGIVTFAQLADSNEQILEKIVREDAGIKLANPASWPEQARLAASGNWDELEQLQEKLHGGKHL